MKVLLGAKVHSNEVKGAVVTIGNFDGLHLGHQALINRLLVEAKSRKSPSVVITFDPHPIQVLFPEKGLKRLFTREDLEKQLSQMGVDYLVVEPFSREFSELKPESFLREFIYEPFHPQKVLIGYDFSFGANRSGSAKELGVFGKQFGFDLETVEAVLFENQPISSTRIRKTLSEGNVGKARALLGRSFYVSGWVEKGEARGRQLGFPTANLHLLSETLPKSGVYACYVHVKDQVYPAVTNIGVKPTFGSEWTAQPKLETYLIDQSLDLYGQQISVEFETYLREEKKFSSLEDLKAQIRLDVETAKKLLKGP